MKSSSRYDAYIDLRIDGQSNVESRGFYVFGLLWDKAYIHIANGITVLRTQSFADEPGTYAFALIPALFWYINKRSWLQIVILGTGLFSTFSVGAILGVLLILALSVVNLLLNKFTSRKLLTNIMIAVSIIIVAAAMYSNRQEKVESYLLTKYDSYASIGETSFGVRLEGFKNNMEHLNDNPIGLGSGGRALLGLQGDIGIVNNVIEAGIVGGTFYIISLVLLGYITLKHLIFSQDVNRILFSRIVIMLLIAGAQRTAIDGSLWGLLFVIILIRMEFNIKLYRIGENYKFRRKARGMIEQ